MEKQYDVIDNVRFNRTSYKAGGTLHADPSDVAELVEQGLLTESKKDKASAASAVQAPVAIGTAVIAPGTNADTPSSTIVDGAPTAVEKPAVPVAKKTAAKKVPAKKTAAKKTTAKSK